MHHAACSMLLLALLSAPAMSGANESTAASDESPAAPAAAAPAQPAAPAQAAAPEGRQVCTRERPIGSNRPVRVCRDAAAAERAGEASREALGRAQEQRYMPPVENR